MPKSRAEIQEAYREKEKAKKGSRYLKKEIERVKTYYKPTTEMNPGKMKIKDSMRKKRIELKAGGE